MNGYILDVICKKKRNVTCMFLNGIHLNIKVEVRPFEPMIIKNFLKVLEVERRLFIPFRNNVNLSVWVYLMNFYVSPSSAYSCTSENSNKTNHFIGIEFFCYGCQGKGHIISLFPEKIYLLWKNVINFSFLMMEIVKNLRIQSYGFIEWIVVCPFV